MRGFQALKISIQEAITSWLYVILPLIISLAIAGFPIISFTTCASILTVYHHLQCNITFYTLSSEIIIWYTQSLAVTSALTISNLPPHLFARQSISVREIILILLSGINMWFILTEARYNIIYWQVYLGVR